MYTSLLPTVFLTLLSTASAEWAIAPSGQTPVVLIPDAWHSTQIYADLGIALSDGDYEIHSSTLQSTGSLDPKNDSVKYDAADIYENLYQPLLDAGNPFYVIMHGYGGLPGSVAAKGISVADRKKARKSGGVAGLIYIAGFIAGNGTSLQSMLPGKQFSSWVTEYSNGQLGVTNASNIFYNGVDSTQTQSAIAKLRNQSENALTSPSQAPAWADSYYDGRRAYAFTLQDRMISLQTQNTSLQKSNVSWTTQQFDTGHSPFLSQTQQLSDWLVKTLNGWNSSVNSTSSSR